MVYQNFDFKFAVFEKFKIKKKILRDTLQIQTIQNIQLVKAYQDKILYRDTLLVQTVSKYFVNKSLKT